MSLADLIRKRPGNSATAISAIPATQEGKKAGTVARVATVAVANLRSLEPFDLEAFEERAALECYRALWARRESRGAKHGD